MLVPVVSNTITITALPSQTLLLVNVLTGISAVCLGYALTWKFILPLAGFVDYLTTEISTSKQKKFPLVTFIDTPGLVDGDMEYPFDVDTAITMLGDMADLIFVLFDPIGQALCRRTLNIVGMYSCQINLLTY